jgi:hypothetical protein
VSKDPDENAIAMANKMQKLGSLFGESCELQFAIELLSGTYTREEIASYAARARARFSKVSLGFHDLEVSFPENSVAKVTVTARLTGQYTDREIDARTRELECSLKKSENKWLLLSYAVIKSQKIETVLIDRPVCGKFACFEACDDVLDLHEWNPRSFCPREKGELPW